MQIVPFMYTPKSEYPQSVFWAEIYIMKNIRIFIWKLSVFAGEIFNIFEKACFRNVKNLL